MIEQLENWIDLLDGNFLGEPRYSVERQDLIEYLRENLEDYRKREQATRDIYELKKGIKHNAYA